MNLLNYKKGVFLLLGILMLSILQPVLVFASAEDMSNSVSIDDQAKKAFIESKEYEKVKKLLKSTKPEYTKPFYDENGQQNAEALVFSAKTSTTNNFNKNKVSGTVTAKVDSPLVAMYNLKDHKVTTVALFDYSKMNTEKKQIKITDFTNDTIAYATPKKLNTKIAGAANEVKKDVTRTITNATEQVNTVDTNNQDNSSNNVDKVKPKYLVSCTVFECTKYKKYGGYIQQGCENIGNYIACPIVGLISPKLPKAGTIATAFCSAVVAIGCYVPKGKICVDGRTYYANACPV